MIQTTNQLTISINFLTLPHALTPTILWLSFCSRPNAHHPKKLPSFQGFQGAGRRLELRLEERNAAVEGGEVAKVRAFRRGTAEVIIPVTSMKHWWGG